jgi:hypothetical protein
MFGAVRPLIHIVQPVSGRQVGFFATIASSVDVRAFPTFSALSAQVVAKSTSKLKVSLGLDTLKVDLREQLCRLEACDGGGIADHQSLQFVQIGTQQKHVVQNQSFVP